jgi:outer membrane protein assembly factor BamB
MRPFPLAAPLAGLLTLLSAANAADWAQWRGPDRTDVSAETGLLKSWPKDGPPLRWTYAEAGVGYSGPAVVGERLFTMGARGPTEYLVALDTKTGGEVWATPVGPTFTFKGNSWGDGPRSTPTVDGDRVYALGGQGELVCVEAATGKEVWRISLLKDLDGEVSPAGGGPEKIGWGYTESPLIDADRLVCTPGGKQGTMASLDKKTGQVQWRSQELTDPATYSSPVAAGIGGVRQYVQMTDLGVVGVAAQDGRLLWRYIRKPAYTDFVIPTPVIRGDEVYTTVGGEGCDLIKVTHEGTKFKATKVYSNKNMKNQHGGGVLVDGHVYGFSDGKGWVCQDFKTGKIVWAEKRKLGRGSLTCADGRLYCYTEDGGTAALVEASPAGWKEIGRFALPRESKLHKPNGKIWTHPVVANGRLYLRDQELLFCFDVRDGARGAR